MSYISVHTPHNRDAIEGYWPREKVVQMDLAAQAKMFRHHRNLASPEIVESVRCYLKRLNWGQAPEFVPTSPSRALQDILAVGLRDMDGLSGEGTIAPKRTALDIKHAIAAKHGLSTIDLDSPSHRASLVVARFEAIYLIATNTTLSWPQIGRMFGGRDHSTAMNAARQHALRNGLTPPRGLENWRKQRSAKEKGDQHA